MSKKREGILRDAKDGAKRQDSSADMFSSVPVWRAIQNISVGELFPASESTLFWLSDPNLPYPVEVHRVVEDGISELPKYIHQGYTIAVEPFDISGGKCAVVQDAFGTRLGVFEKSRGAVVLELSEAD